MPQRMRSRRLTWPVANARWISARLSRARCASRCRSRDAFGEMYMRYLLSQERWLPTPKGGDGIGSECRPACCERRAALGLFELGPARTQLGSRPPGVVVGRWSIEVALTGPGHGKLRRSRRSTSSLQLHCHGPHSRAANRRLLWTRTPEPMPPNAAGEALSARARDGDVGRNAETWSGTKDEVSTGADGPGRRCRANPDRSAPTAKGS